MKPFIAISNSKGEVYGSEEKISEKKECGSYTRVTLNAYEARCRTKYVFPKRSKSMTD